MTAPHDQPRPPVAYDRSRIPDRPPSGTPVLGLDVGGVIVHRAAHGTDTSFFGDRPMDTPAVVGAVEGTAALAEAFGGRVHLVSKAGQRIAGLTRDWLAHTGFHEATGVAAEQVWFVRRRRDKAEVCERLGVTHFVDDRLDVLDHLGAVPNRFLFTGGLPVDEQPPNLDRSRLPYGFVVTDRWPDLVDRVLRTLRQHRTGP